MNENETNPNPGNSESIWNFSLLWESALDSSFIFNSNVTKNEKWGSLLIQGEPTCCGSFHAKIGKLFDRDILMDVIETMVSHVFKPLWAMSTYKVYPGFWGVDKDSTG